VKTSYFGVTSAKTPGAIAISLYLPRGKKYVHYPQLAPTPELLETYKSPSAWALMDVERYYISNYFDQLMVLNAQTVWNELHELANGAEPILLCYEKPGDFCHRRLVAKWFEVELGKVVDEATK
jgi:uncharacterized protein (DUF488 family)